MRPLLIAMTLLLAAAGPTPPAPQGTLLVGDSMMRVGVGPVLKRMIAAELAEPAELRAKSATGLSRPDVYDWPTELKKVFDTKKYQRAVVMIGANDCQPLTEDGKGLAFGTTAWNDAYKKRVKAFLALLCDGAKEVLWLGLPPMRSPKFNGRVQALNDLLETEVEASACATWVPSAPVLADGNGAFAAYRKVAKRKLKIREDDGVHISPNGGQLVSQTLLTLLRKDP